MVEEDRKEVEHKFSTSQYSIESEIGGHEQLKSLLIEHDDIDAIHENIKVSEALNLMKEAGGDGNL